MLLIKQNRYQRHAFQLRKTGANFGYFHKDAQIVKSKIQLDYKATRRSYIMLQETLNAVSFEVGLSIVSA